jgi:hypothetical protein
MSDAQIQAKAIIAAALIQSRLGPLQLSDSAEGKRPHGGDPRRRNGFPLPLTRSVGGRGRHSARGVLMRAQSATPLCVRPFVMFSLTFSTGRCSPRSRATA